MALGKGFPSLCVFRIIRRKGVTKVIGLAKRKWSHRSQAGLLM